MTDPWHISEAPAPMPVRGYDVTITLDVEDDPDADEWPYVCPGCLRADAPCAPGCWEAEREAREIDGCDDDDEDDSDGDDWEDA